MNLLPPPPPGDRSHGVGRHRGRSGGQGERDDGDCGYGAAPARDQVRGPDERLRSGGDRVRHRRRAVRQDVPPRGRELAARHGWGESASERGEQERDRDSQIRGEGGERGRDDARSGRHREHPIGARRARSHNGAPRDRGPFRDGADALDRGCRREPWDEMHRAARGGAGVRRRDPSAALRHVRRHRRGQHRVHDVSRVRFAGSRDRELYRS